MVARGFAELRRVAMARGAKAETLMGLSGLGDVVLTCTSARSRNYALGQKLGQAMSLEAALAAGFGVAEGAATAQAAVSLAEKCAVEAPVMQAVADMLQGTRSLADIHQDLINRPLKVED
jgi:glycerol-3-phosphate dehydrogenase (NAD(P)+)